MKVVGARVIVEKEKLNSNGLKITHQVDKDGLSNTGKIVAIGSFWMRLFGIREGKTIQFRKHFITNEDQPNELVFVEFADIYAIN
jgi:co-chaperonin GroES (HSP10)